MRRDAMRYFNTQLLTLNVYISQPTQYLRQDRCLNVCGTLHTIYTIYYLRYGLTLLKGLGLEDIPTLCLK